MTPFLRYLVEQDTLMELTDGPHDSLSPIGGGKDIPSANALARTENELQIDDTVKIIGKVEHQGEKGQVIAFGSKKSSVVVQLDGKDYSFHSSDVKRIEDDEDSEDDEDNNRELNNWLELAGLK